MEAGSKVTQALLVQWASACVHYLPIQIGGSPALVEEACSQWSSLSVAS